MPTMLAPPDTRPLDLLVTGIRPWDLASALAELGASTISFSTYAVTGVIKRTASTMAVQGIVIDADDVIAHGSLPLGVSRTPDYRTYGASLERDGLVVFYTDGISEFQRDIAKTEVALLEAIDDAVATSAPRPADAIRRVVLGDEEPGDDAVLLVLRIAPTDEVKAAAPRERWSFHSSHAYSAHNARHEVMNFIRQFAGSDQELFTAELILGEILANTVEHAPGLVNVEVDWSNDSPVVTVVDTGPGLDRFVALLPDDELTESDRGYGTKLTVTLPLVREPETV